MTSSFRKPTSYDTSIKLLNVQSLKFLVFPVFESFGAELARLYKIGNLDASPNRTPSNVLPIRKIVERGALIDRHFLISSIRFSIIGIKQLSIGKDDIDISLNSSFKKSVSVVFICLYF